MLPDDQTTATPGRQRDLLRRLARWLADVAQANPHAVRHQGGCGRRLFCPRHGADGYRRAEILANGDLLLHCEGVRLTRSDAEYAERLAGLAE